MFKNMNPILKAVIMFVIGCIVILAAEWLVALIKQQEFAVNWATVIGGGAVIAVLDYIFPADRRKENRDKLKDRFKK